MSAIPRSCAGSRPDRHVSSYTGRHVSAYADRVDRLNAYLKSLLRLGLNVRGVYGEVSGGVERVVAGRVPEVPPDVAEQVLGKAVEPHQDGRHYTREITNVGPKTKLLVGNPLLD